MTTITPRIKLVSQLTQGILRSDKVMDKVLEEGRKSSMFPRPMGEYVPTIINLANKLADEIERTNPLPQLPDVLPPGKIEVMPAR